MRPRRGPVLVVDDDPSVAATLRDMLLELGYGVKLAITGEEALGVADIYQPEVVLLDINLPGLTGDQVLERLVVRQASLAVVMVTGNTDPMLARRTLARGAFDYIAKPFDMARLAKVLEAAAAYGGE